MAKQESYWTYDYSGGVFFTPSDYPTEIEIDEEYWEWEKFGFTVRMKSEKN